MVKKPRRPRLSDDDLRLWQRVAASITPLHPKPSAKQSPSVTPVTDNLPRLVAATAVQPPIGRAWPEPTPDIRAMAKTLQRAVKRGTIEPEMRIDLHGDRYDVAKMRLMQFVSTASRHNARTVLVITGKGGSMIAREHGVEHSGVIRRALPGWLGDPQIARMVSHYTHAHPKHGGEGAWYVFIRTQTRLNRK